MKIRTDPSGYQIDLYRIFRGIADQSINFEVVHMEKFRLREWVAFETSFRNQGHDLTGNIVLVDGIGLVDGYFALGRMRGENNLAPAIYLKLRNILHCIEDLIYADQSRLRGILNRPDYSVGSRPIYGPQFFKSIKFPWK